MNVKPNVDTIFCSAIEIESSAEREEYVERACGGNADLARQVERLLDAHFNGGSLLDTPVEFKSDLQPITEKIGDTIGPYKLLRELGEGGMGVVYEAEQVDPVRRRVALKLIKPGMDTKQVLARFEAERQTLALMNHHNIARVLDAGVTETGRPYFAMELVEGVPITTYCDQCELTVRERLRLVVPVCQAIQHAHQKGIIHRDIKPSNVLVALYDGRPVPKVIDFGIAKATEQELTERTMFTQMGQIVGTWEYMSPEQAETNALDVDTRSDVYSLGVLLYELLTGTTPISQRQVRQGGLAQILALIRDYEPPKPSTRLIESGESLPSISAVRKTEPARLSKLLRGDLDWIVMKALEKNRSRRYETANGLGEDIECFLNDKAISACPPSTSYKLRKFAQRNRRALAMALTLAMILLMASGISVWQAIRAMRAERIAVARLKELVAEQADADEVLALVKKMFRSPDPESDGHTVTVVELLNHAAETSGVELAGQPRRQAFLQDAIGSAYEGLGLHSSAIPLREQVRDYFLEHYGPEHRRTLNAMHGLAITYRGAGRTGDAMELDRQVLDLRRQIQGDEDPDTLKSMSSLSVDYLAASRWNDAIEQCEEIIRLSRDQSLTLIAMHNQAIAYQNSGQLGTAMRLNEQVLNARREMLGKEHPDTLRSMNNLATVYRMTDHLGQAIELLRQLVPLSQDVFGHQHSFTHTSIRNLATTLMQMDESANTLWSEGNPKKSIEVRIEAWEACRDAVGPEHAYTIISMHNLAHAYEVKGELDEAMSITEGIIKMAHHIERAEHPDSIKALAASYDRRARRTLAAPEDSTGNGFSAVEDATRACQLTDMKAPWFLDTLAAAYAQSHRFTEAVRYQQRAVELQSQDKLAPQDAKQAYQQRLASYQRQRAQPDASPAQTSSKTQR